MASLHACSLARSDTGGGGGGCGPLLARDATPTNPTWGSLETRGNRRAIHGRADWAPAWLGCWCCCNLCTAQVVSCGACVRLHMSRSWSGGCARAVVEGRRSPYWLFCNSTAITWGTRAADARAPLEAAWCSEGCGPCNLNDAARTTRRSEVKAVPLARPAPLARPIPLASRCQDVSSPRSTTPHARRLSFGRVDAETAAREPSLVPKRSSTSIVSRSAQSLKAACLTTSVCTIPPRQSPATAADPPRTHSTDPSHLL